MIMCDNIMKYRAFKLNKNKISLIADYIKKQYYVKINWSFIEFYWE